MTMLHSHIIERFKRLALAKRMAHAYLFAGPAQTGKTDAAIAVAQLVNCQEKNAPCGQCASCSRIAAGNHPDVYIIGRNDEGAIKIDEIRQMLGRVGLRAYEAAVKVFILHEAHQMTTEAANALLKTLEEPAPNTLIILTSSVPEACLDTIKSRCHTVKFFTTEDALPQDRDRMLDLLLAKGNDEYLKELSTDKAQSAAAMLVMLSWLRDVMLYKSGAGEEQLLHRGRLAETRRMSQKGMDDLGALQAQIVRVKSLSDDNLNVKMALSLVRQRLWDN